MRFLTLLSLLLGLSLVSTAAAAPVVYDNGPSITSASAAIGFVADDFIFDVDTLVTGTNWPGSLPNAPRQWLILTDSPFDNKPTALFASGLFDSGAPEMFTNPVLLQGGQRYWLAVFHGDLSDPCSVRAPFNASAPKGSEAAQISHPSGLLQPAEPFCTDIQGEPYDYGSGFWSHADFLNKVSGDPSLDFGIAFQLFGTPVPEPSLLILLALSGAASARRVRRRR